MKPVWVIGGGPAGLMAAEQVARAGLPVMIADHKPSLARKFLMAGKSGLNLTMDEPLDEFQRQYFEGANWLRPMLSAFGPEQVKAFATGLEQEIFTGTTGRIFPVAMKASPMLRAWLRRLRALGVETRTHWRWTGWQEDALTFETLDGPKTEEASATILALGGGSWARLGSDGTWAEILAQAGVGVTPFAPSNSALDISWSSYMSAYFGTPLKSIALAADAYKSRGEVTITEKGLEGGGLYSITPGIRGGAPLEIDLAPDLSIDEITSRLEQAKSSDSTANKLRKALRLPKVKQAILQEFARPLPSDPSELAIRIKRLQIKGATLGALDDAISTAGGIAQNAVNEDLMLKAKPGTFAAGEMLAWDAPTGGYLITACLATGAWAGNAAANWTQVSQGS